MATPRPDNEHEKWHIRNGSIIATVVLTVAAVATVWWMAYQQGHKSGWTAAGGDRLKAAREEIVRLEAFEDSVTSPLLLVNYPIPCGQSIVVHQCDLVVAWMGCEVIPNVHQESFELDDRIHIGLYDARSNQRLLGGLNRNPRVLLGLSVDFRLRSDSLRLTAAGFADYKTRDTLFVTLTKVE